MRREKGRDHRGREKYRLQVSEIRLRTQGMGSTMKRGIGKVN